MEKFEYMTKVEPKSIVDWRLLNKLGSEGWEMISVIEGNYGDGDKLRYYFKRKLRE